MLNRFIDPAPRSKTLVCVLTVRLEYTILSVGLSEIQISKFRTWNSVTGVRGIWNSASGYHYIPILSDIYANVFIIKNVLR